MFSRLKSLPLTIVLTVLIWMYAEAEFTSTQENVGIRVQVESADPNATSVRVLTESGARIQILNLSVSLQGAKSQVERIVQQSRAPQAGDAGLRPLALTVSPPLDGADNTVSLVPLLNQHSFFRDRGVTVTACIPDRVRVDADKLVRFTKPVDKINRNGVPVTIDRFDPPSVTVTVPAKVLAALGGEGAVTVSADPQEALTRGNVGKLRPVPVRLVAESKGDPLAARDDRITVTPQDATCYLTVNAQFTEHFRPRPVPVLVTGPAEVLSPYRIELTPREVTVEVTGTPETIAKLRAAMAPGSSSPPEDVIRAYLDITAEDRPTTGLVSRRLRYALPEGVSLDTKVDKVDFRLSEMTPATRP